jgi:hypothetical protein
VTWRAILIAFASLIVLTPLAFYVETVWYRVSDVTSGVPASAPVVVLVLLTALMALPAFRRTGLTQRELLTIYSLVLVGGTVIGHGIFPIALSRNIAFHYMARTNPHWEPLFLSYIPDWFAPSEFEIVEGYFQGAPSVPWSAWWVPLGALWALLILLFMATLSAMVIFRRQWISHERLSFPLSEIPLQTVRAVPGEKGGAGRLTVRWVFWAGVLISLCVNFNNDLAQRVPSVPTIPLGPVPIIRWQRVGAWAGLGNVELILWPWMIAIAYLVPRELAFSVWFFWLVRLAQHVLAVMGGATPREPSEWYGPDFPAPYFQGGGAAFTLLVLLLWASRRYLVQIVRLAFGSRRRIDGREAGTDEAGLCRWALIAFALSIAGLLYFCWLAGCRLAFGLLFIGTLVGYFCLMARLRAEAGLGFLCYPIELQGVFMGTIGSKAFRRAELVTIASTHWSFQSGTGLSFEALPGSVMDSLRIAHSGRIDTRRLLVVIIAVFLLALLVSSYVTMAMMYHHGFMGLRRSLSYTNFQWQTLHGGSRIANWLTSPSDVNVGGIAAFFAGGAVVLFLGTMRLRFWWWPFHPLGYIAANSWGGHWHYMPFFIGWAAKSLVIRYGGLRLYRATVPLAVGLIVGDMLNVGVWTVVALVTRGRV